MEQDKAILVIGARDATGGAVARRFAREGFAVALMARRAEALGSIVAGIAAEGGSAHAVPVDLSDLAALDAAFASVRERMGPPEVLAYNAGRWVETPAMALAPANHRMKIVEAS